MFSVVLAGAGGCAPDEPPSGAPTAVAGAVGVSATPSTSAAPAAAATPVELANTAVHDVPARATGRRYQVWVDVPASYATGSEAHPVVFVTDAQYSFPLVRSIRNLLGQQGRNIEDFILVGLPPEQGLTSKESRSRDYTPTNPLERRTASARASTYTASVYGEAEAYRDWLESDVFPFVATTYRADMRRTVFAGHSLGGLFGAYVLLTKPEMFDTYVLSSPSLWFDRHAILRFEERYASAHRDLPARVLLYIGMYETKGEGPRYFEDTDMVGDVRAFERLLESRRYPSLDVESRVVEDEDHLSVFPATISRALVRALPGRGPYTSG